MKPSNPKARGFQTLTQFQEVSSKLSILWEQSSREGLISRHTSCPYPLVVAPIVIEKAIDNIALNINTIIPFGLIFTELITNSIKYAKNSMGEHKLKIQAVKNNNTFLTAKDAK